MSKIIITSILAVIGALFLCYEFIRDDFKFPKKGESKKKKIVLFNGSEKIEKYIWDTGGLNHMVPLSEVVSGGPRKNGIPSIDNPKFISTNEADLYLPDAEPGIALQIGKICRFYPFEILVWHKIVNDSIDNERVVVSYCPLCFSGIAFSPIVNGEKTNFGVSGKLWNSNLVIYDRKTDSLWAQILGECIVGEAVGQVLERLPANQICYGGFKKLYKNGEVLSRNTGFFRFYGDDPYSNYYTINEIFFPVNKEDDRLNYKDFILGIMVNNKYKAYLIDSLQENVHIEEIFENKKIIAKYDKNAGLVFMFAENGNGVLERINPIPTFWFSWAAMHPDTEVYK